MTLLEFLMLLELQYAKTFDDSEESIHQENQDKNEKHRRRRLITLIQNSKLLISGMFQLSPVYKAASDPEIIFLQYALQHYRDKSKLLEEYYDKGNLTVPYATAREAYAAWENLLNQSNCCIDKFRERRQ